VKKFNETFNLS